MIAMVVNGRALLGAYRGYAQAIAAKRRVGRAPHAPPAGAGLLWGMFWAPSHKSQEVGNTNARIIRIYLYGQQEVYVYMYIYIHKYMILGSCNTYLS